MGFVLYENGEVVKLFEDQETLAMYEDFLSENGHPGIMNSEALFAQEVKGDKRWDVLKNMHPDKILTKDDFIRYLELCEKTNIDYSDIFRIEDLFEYIIGELKKLGEAKSIPKKKRKKIKKLESLLTPSYHEIMYLLSKKTFK